MKTPLQTSDPKVYELIEAELGRRRKGLEMIPSENHTSPAVLEALGSMLTDKYSEGYPGKRYYGGNQFIDQVEDLAIERAKQAFLVPYANVQPYSGSPANLAVHVATCKPGDATMGLDLSHGGHLTHGSKVSVTGQYYQSFPYHVGADGRINLEEVRSLARERKPVLMWVGYTAYSREFPFREFAEIADEAGAYLAADISHIAGLVLGGAHPSPVPYVHIVTTTTHKTLRGPRGALIMVTGKGLQKDPELGEKIQKAVFPGLQGGPHNHQTAAIAVALGEAMKPEFQDYAHQIVKNAKVLAQTLVDKGLTLVSGGTDTHLMVVDLTPFGKGMGVFAEKALDLAGITLNKNTIPGDPSSPFYPSGIRLGTPALTTRGMKEQEMALVAGWITRVIGEVKAYQLPEPKDERRQYVASFEKDMAKNPVVLKVREEIETLCESFPLPY